MTEYTTPSPHVQQEISDLVSQVEYSVEVIRLLSSMAGKMPTHRLQTELEEVAEKLLGSVSHAYLAIGPFEEVA